MKNIYVKLSRGITDAFDRLNQATLLMKNSEFSVGIYVNNLFLLRNNLKKDDIHNLFFPTKKNLILFEDDLVNKKKLFVNVKDFDKFKDNLINNDSKTVILLRTKRNKKEKVIKYNGKWHKNNYTYSDIFKNLLKDSPFDIDVKSLVADNYKTLFLQYRLGDICIVPCNLLIRLFNIDKKYMNHFIIPEKVPINRNILNQEDINKLKLNGKINKEENFLQALDRFVLPKIYIDFLNKNQNKFNKVILSSDGLSLASKSIKKFFKIKKTSSEIEIELENFYLGDIKKRCSEYLIGDSNDLIYPTVMACAKSSNWQMGGGSFPFDFVIKFYGSELPFYKNINFVNQKNKLETTNSIALSREKLKNNRLKSNLEDLLRFI